MKNKIIAIILCISVISSIFVISCFATVETIKTNQKYSIELSAGTAQSQLPIFNISFEYQLNVGGRIITGTDTTLPLYIEDGKVVKISLGYDITVDNQDSVIYIKFNNISNLNTTQKEYLKQILVLLPDAYNHTEDFLTFSLNSVKTFINYMITNNVILIVIAIVLVSFAVGALIRIKRKKF